MSLPGVNVGPLDPDRTASFGQVSGRTSARQLIRIHAQAHPLVLQKALARKLDDERSKALDMDEVRDYLDGVELPNGDPAVPDGAEVVGASVRGERDQPQVLTYTFRIEESGRTAKWFADYNESVLPKSYAAGSDRVHLAELRERGVAVTESSIDTAPKRTRREAPKDDAEKAELLRRVEAAERRVAELEAEEPDADASAEAEAEREAAEAEQPDEGAAAAEPPFEGYEDVNAAEMVKRIKADDTPDEEVQAILDFERTHANRKSVVGAAEVALGSRGSAE
jgi:hypothetical protein